MSVFFGGKTKIGSINYFPGDSCHITFNGPITAPDFSSSEEEEGVAATATKFVEGPSADEVKHDKVVENDTDPCCVVCLENSPICIATPCNHLSYCVRCSRTLCYGPNGDEEKTVDCAECRNAVTSIKRVFFQSKD